MLYPPNQHTGKARHKHEGQKNYFRLGPSKVKDTGEDDTVDVHLAERRGDSESSDQEHDSWGEHARENKS